MSGQGTVWVSVTSHRARGRLKREVAGLGPSFGINTSWPPRGEYYEVPEKHADSLRRIKGLRVLRSTPGNDAKLFKYMTSADLGGPEPGNFPVPKAEVRA